MLYFFIFTLVTCSLGASLPVENVPMYDHGILYEQLRNVRMELGSWTLETSYSLIDLELEIDALENMTRVLMQSCRELNSEFGLDCNRLTKNINILLTELLPMRGIIYSTCPLEIINNSITTQRIKRGLFDGFGEMEKMLFGTMSNNDRERIDKDLVHLHDNEDQLTHQLEKQTVAIDSIFELTNKSISTLEKEVASFSNVINFYNKKYKEETTKSIVRNQIFELLNEIELLFEHSFRKKDMFYTLMMSEKTSLSPAVYNPAKFLKDLIKVRDILPPTFEFIVPLSFEYIMQLYPVSTMKSNVVGCNIKVNIEVPITNKLIYEAYKGTSVPLLRNGRLFITPIKNDVILKTFNSDIGMTMTYTEYKQCKSLLKFKLCPSMHILENLTTSEECNARTFLNNSGTFCVPQPLNLQHQIWIQLIDHNAWIYAVPNITNLMIFYNNKTFNMEINMVGKLKLTKPCFIKSKNILLHYYPKTHSTIELNEIKMDFGFSPQEIKFIDTKVPDTIENSVITHTNGKILLNEINNLKVMNAGKIQLLDIELEKHSFSFWKAIFILIIIVVFLWLSFKTFKCLKLKIKRGRNPEVSLHETQPIRIISQEIESNKVEQGMSNVQNLPLQQKMQSRVKRVVMGETSF